MVRECCDGRRIELVEGVSLPLGAMDDLFIACASFEPRCTAAAERLSPQYKAHTAVIYVNQEVLDPSEANPVQQNLHRLRALLDQRSDKVLVAEGSWIDVKRQVVSIRETLFGIDSFASIRSITIDSTTFNRESLLTTVALLRENLPAAVIRIIYVSPSAHGEWLSRGYRTIRNVLGFPGVQNSSLDNALVILCGFEADRALRLIEEHEPTLVQLGIGDPPTHADFLSRNLSAQEEILSKLVLRRQEVRRFQFPTASISACCDYLDSAIAPLLPRYNVVIAPMSTKLSTLAAMLIAEQYRQIQITYCVVSEYNTALYSQGATTAYIEKLPRLHEA